MTTFNDNDMSILTNDLYTSFTPPTLSMSTQLRLDFLRLGRNHDRNESLNRTSNSLGCQMDVEVEPYRTLLGDEFSVSELQGGEIKEIKPQIMIFFHDPFLFFRDNYLFNSISTSF